MIAGTSSGTVTDIEGNYTVANVPKNGTLRVSYIGYKSEDVAVGGRTRIDVTLKPDNAQLDEAIVVGYAVGSKRTVSGAIDRVKKEVTANMLKGYSELNDATTIERIDAAVSEDNSYYTLSGVKVQKPTRGIYIVGGRKVIVK